MPPNETSGTPEQPAATPTPVPEDYVVVDNFNINHDPEDLVRYRGNWVAWSRDGRKVLFASPDPYKLCEMVDAAGLQPGEYVLGGIPPEDYFPEPGLVALD
jgi:hypothetical protein